MKSREHKIAVTMGSGSGLSAVYAFKMPQGYLDATFDPNVRWFGIANLHVEQAERRRGIGKLLVRRALETAESLESNLVYSAIISRECIDVMQHTFGEEHVEVTELGTYTPLGEPDRHDARATLMYRPTK